MSTLPLLAEPSVYGFETAKTQSGTISVRELSIRNHKKMTKLNQQLKVQQEKIEGLTSIIEGLSASIGVLEMRCSEVPEVGEGSDRALLEDLGKMIDKIDQSYVTKTALQKILGQEQPSTSVKPETLKEKRDVEEGTPKREEQGVETEVERDDLEKLPPSKLYSEGKALFAKKRYAQAWKRFNLADTKGYKPAASNYYLGEIAYYTKAYEDAVFHFKKSAGLNSDASYIDVLLLHTGIALEKRGEKEQAKIFYTSVIENHGERKTAKIAKKHLQILEENR